HGQRTLLSPSSKHCTNSVMSTGPTSRLSIILPSSAATLLPHSPPIIAATRFATSGRLISSAVKFGICGLLGWRRPSVQAQKPDASKFAISNVRANVTRSACRDHLPHQRHDHDLRNVDAVPPKREPPRVPFHQNAA